MQAIRNVLNEVSTFYGGFVTMEDSPSNSDSRNAIVLVGLRPEIKPGLLIL